MPSRSIPAALVALATIGTSLGAQQAPSHSNAGFSFAVYGDSRSMMYVPYMQNQEAEARQLVVDMFNLVLPEKVAAEVVQRDVKFVYDSTSHELVQMVMPFMTASEVDFLAVDKGWVTEASIEDVKLLPGVRTPMFRLAGGDWVAREVVKSVKSGRADFIVNTGDLVWWGKQAAKPSENPYWQLVNDEVLKQMPPPSQRMMAAGLPGRVYPAAGNHEVWEDNDAEGLLTAFPYLKKFGVSDKNFTYSFDYQGARFIFLWTGHYDYREPTAWGATRPTYEEQMKLLRDWLDGAKAKKIKNVFVSFHSPVFARSGMGAIPDSQNPHQVFASYAKDLDIVVFNGHVHTTELYQVDGVKYLMLGGGGAEQDPILPGRTKIKVPEGYPPDLYWKGAPPREEYNYLLVDVRPGQPTRFTLNRFRPWSSEPFATVELFK